MEPPDATVVILREIRTEVGKTNERLDQTNERLDQTNERLGRLERRQADSEIRLATEIVAVVRAVNEVRDVLRAGFDLREQVESHEHRIIRLEQKA